MLLNTTAKTIGFNSYFDGYTPESNRSHFVGTRQELLKRIHEVLDDDASEQLGLVSEGFAKGTLKIRIESEGVFTPMVALREGDVVTNEFGARFPGDSPALKGGTVEGSKSQASTAFVVLYSRPTLLNDWQEACNEAQLKGEDTPPKSAFLTDEFDFEVACLQGNNGIEDDPQNPISLARNILGKAGGTGIEIDGEKAKKMLFELANGVMFYATHAQAKG